MVPATQFSIMIELRYLGLSLFSFFQGLSQEMNWKICNYRSSYDQFFNYISCFTHGSQIAFIWKLVNLNLSSSFPETKLHSPLWLLKLDFSMPKTWFLKVFDANASLNFVGKFNLGKLYEKIGFNKEIISRGRFAELLTAEHRPFR